MYHLNAVIPRRRQASVVDKSRGVCFVELVPGKLQVIVPNKNVRHILGRFRLVLCTKRVSAYCDVFRHSWQTYLLVYFCTSYSSVHSTNRALAQFSRPVFPLHILCQWSRIFIRTPRVLGLLCNCVFQLIQDTWPKYYHAHSSRDVRL